MAWRTVQPADDARTDAELIDACATDATAFRRLYDRHAVAIHAYFVRRAPSADALDLVAETFAQAWLSCARFTDRRDGDAGPWLYGIARHVWFRSLRATATERRARERLELLAGAPAVVERHPTGSATWSSPAAVDRDGRDDEGHGDAVEALATLPSGQRDAVRLRVVDGLGYDVIGAQLDCTPLAARIRVSRGLDGIRRTLEDRR